MKYKMPKILVTGGAGYIGSHTIVELIQAGYEVISIDNFSRSSITSICVKTLEGIEAITGKPLKNYNVDLRDYEATKAVFEENNDIVGVIHFAAFKAVGESVENPILYFMNNINSLNNLLACVSEYNIQQFVFSSSCTVYGIPDSIPVTEIMPCKPAESPYGYTKQVGEDVLRFFTKRPYNKTQVCLLRYFNPAGAHPSLTIGESVHERVSNLTPAIVKVALGQTPHLSVFGTDYPTRDGSCIRDFIHVSDIASAHVSALSYMQENPKEVLSTFNLGNGEGVSVMEAIAAFERVNGIALPVVHGQRRAGDVPAIYADSKKANLLLKWVPQYTLEDIMRTAWGFATKNI